MQTQSDGALGCTLSLQLQKGVLLPYAVAAVTPGTVIYRFVEEEEHRNDVSVRSESFSLSFLSVFVACDAMRLVYVGKGARAQ